MIEVADVLRRYGPAYLEQFGDKMPASHRRAFDGILRCRTAALGGRPANRIDELTPPQWKELFLPKISLPSFPAQTGRRTA